MGTMSSLPKFEVAIIGGGIVGLVTAIGLLRRKISVKMYEQSSSFREIGAGVAFTANALECMSLIDPAIVEAVNAVATPNGEDVDNPNDFLRWHDGYHWDPDHAEGSDDRLLFLLDSGYKGFQGCHRAHLLDKLVQHVPADVIEFGKRLEGYEDRGPHQKLLLLFNDGTRAEADAVIGCDGIKSKVRQLVLGPENPASYPHFSHKVAYRALVPMTDVEPVLGSFKAHNQHMHTGPSTHILHFPVAGHTMLNVVAFVDDWSDWPLENANSVGNMVAPATRRDLEAAFEGWGPTVCNLVKLLPEKIDKWAIFDTYDYPAPTFVSGRICLAGDAAHASSPHHGAGAGIGVEDALALCTLLQKALEKLTIHCGAGGQGDRDAFHGLHEEDQTKVTATLEHALSVYDKVRPPRSRWLVKSSREVCDIYEWKYPETQMDWDKCLKEITARSHKLWYFDIEGMLGELLL